MLYVEQICRLACHLENEREAILHYDHHDYAEQKRAALEKWEAELKEILTHDD